MKSFPLRSIIAVLVLCLICTCNDDSGVSDNQNIVGAWHIMAIHNSSPSGPTLGPNTGEVISIIFLENGKFTGTTSANTFGGEYSATENRLLIKEMFTTEVADTNFGNVFYETFNESRNSETGFSEFEIVVKAENMLNLEFKEFKFISLQKRQS
ncbi:META domain-containing protein [Flagellimonas sp. CMM7]|uniref:META domain-containing protein n=1 Tax=Flagellimonas sp. CMM7 TaxID=2654676 RepID=UPI0013D4834F|nr:META domain-containing protein [Flagellimonas sp. CMM7]UII81403.1 META domain-containing protein [Flagellimonas sp. CMM7]